MSEPDMQIAPRDNPYFGLEYYDERFGAWFFGREAEGSKIITNLRAARLTLLHAESGVGKSSLLRAGVAWRMRRLADDMFARRGTVRSVPVVFTSWKDDPCGELAGCVGEAIQPYLAKGPVPALPAGRLDLAIEAASGAVNANLLIMLDQFEEYFLYRSREPVPDRFADELARCINRTDLRANFLIAIREDAYAGLGDLFKGRIPNVYGNYLHIDYLDRAAAEKAIREPLGVYNSQRDASEQVRLQDELVDAVLDEVRAVGGDAGTRPGQPADANGNGNVRIATPLLQLVMERVWNAERAENSHELRLATLQKLRGVRMIADAHLGKALGSLSSAERQTAIDMFDHLVTPSGGKIAESVSDLARRTGHKEEQVSGVLAKLDHERIVRPVPAAPGQDPMRFRRYEIFHDVLAPTINRAIAAREEQRRVRRIRRFAALAVALLVVVSAVAVAFAYLLINANNEKLTAESRQLAAEASLDVTSNPELSSQLALAALHLHYTAQAEDALRAALPGLQTVRTFQNGTTVYTAAFDPVDDNAVLSSDFSGTAAIWNATTGQRMVSMAGGGYSHTRWAGSAVFNPSGSQVAVGYGNGTVAVFDARSGRKLESATDGFAGIDKVAFLGNTGMIAIASQQNVALWRPQNGSQCCDVISDQPAYSIAANPRNPSQFVVTTTSGDAVILTRTRSGVRQRRLVTHSVTDYNYVDDAEFSPDGSKIVTAETDGSISIYDLATPKAPPTTLSAGEANASTAAFSPDGTRIVAGYSSGMVRVWDVATRLPLTQLAGNAGVVLSAHFSTDGSKVVTASEDGTIRVWYAQPRELRTEFTIPPGSSTPEQVGGVGYISDRILAVGADGIDVLTAGGRQQAVINDPALWSLASNRAGTEILTEDTTGLLTLWQAAGTGYVRVSRLGPIYVDRLGGVRMTADGSRFADLFTSITIEIRSTDTGQVERTLTAVNPVDWYAVSPTGSQVAAGDYFGRVEVWNATAVKPTILGSPGPQVLDVAYNQSGTEFVTASASGTVIVWDARDNRQVKAISACPSASTARFSPDGSKIAVACGDGTIRVFGAASGQALTTIQATTAGIVNEAAFSPDGNSIVAAVDTGSTGYVEVWNAELATPSLPALEHIASQRVQQLTAAQQQQYLNGVGG
jgi:WD40 repeat protein